MNAKTKPAKKAPAKKDLFELSNEELKLVVGGVGIVHTDK